MVGQGTDLRERPRTPATTTSGPRACSARSRPAGSPGRFVLASSMVVYGEGGYSCRDPRAGDPGPRGERRPLRRALRASLSGVRRAAGPAGACSESAALDPRNLYAATKVHQEHLCACFARESGATVTALRYHNVYGPRMPRDTPYAGVASIFASALARGEAPRVFEDGGQLRDFVHVRDVARANVLALTGADAGAGSRSTSPADGRAASLRWRGRWPHAAPGADAPRAGGHRRLPAGGRPPRVRLAPTGPRGGSGSPPARTSAPAWRSSHGSRCGRHERRLAAGDRQGPAAGQGQDPAVPAMLARTGGTAGRSGAAGHAGRGGPDAGGAQGAGAGRRLHAVGGALAWRSSASEARCCPTGLATRSPRSSGPALLIGMDTPQLTAELLSDGIEALRSFDAVLGPARDGGLLERRSAPGGPRRLPRRPDEHPGHAAAPARALRTLGLATYEQPQLRDVDTIADARAVAREAPGSRFARALAGIAWRAMTAPVD